MSKGIATATALALCLISPAVLAEDDYRPDTTHFTVDVGVLFGGEKLAERTYVLGGTDSVYAGKAVFADVGVLHNFDASDWSLKGTVGVQSGFSAGLGSDITFTRYPIDLVALYNVGNQHFGGGLTYHANPQAQRQRPCAGCGVQGPGGAGARVPIPRVRLPLYQHPLSGGWRLHWAL